MYWNPRVLQQEQHRAQGLEGRLEGPDVLVGGRRINAFGERSDADDASIAGAKDEERCLLELGSRSLRGCHVVIFPLPNKVNVIP